MTEKKITAFIIEDDIEIGGIEARFVGNNPAYTLLGMANSINDAEKALQGITPDLIVLDITFHDGNGLELLKKLRSDGVQSDVILLTASNDAETLQQAIRLGIFDYVLKPANFSRFSQALDNYCRHRRKLTNMGAIEQRDVDQLLQNQPEKQTDFPKGIDGLTFKKFEEFIESLKQETTAEEAAAVLGVSRSTARRYLEYMVSLGRLVPQHLYKSVGRPERLYKKSSA